METFSVYILYSKSADKYYIGHTNDIHRRLKEHNDPSATTGKFCAKNGPWELCFTEEGFSCRAEAMNREKQIKSWKSRKMIIQLINSRKLDL
jgi:putative endonuclease